MDIERLISDFKSGKPVIIFDDPKREGEGDIVIHASFCTPEKIRLLRQDAGGMICLCTSMEIRKKLGLDFYSDYLRNGVNDTMRKLAIGRTAYGDEPSFCTYINSKKTYTGISDEDRSLTVREFSQLIEGDDEKLHEKFVEKFYAPGHIPLLSSRGISKRHGHTEMAVELCEKAGMSSAVVICEMLGDNSKALDWKGVLAYSKKKGFFAIMGNELLNEIKK